MCTGERSAPSAARKARRCVVWACARTMSCSTTQSPLDCLPADTEPPLWEQLCIRNAADENPATASTWGRSAYAIAPIFPFDRPMLHAFHFCQVVAWCNAACISIVASCPQAPTFGFSCLRSVSLLITQGKNPMTLLRKLSPAVAHAIVSQLANAAESHIKV